MKAKMKKEKKRLIEFTILIMLVMLSFILTKADMLALNMGLFFISFGYLALLFKIQEIYFSSRRVRILFFLHIFLDLIIFFISDFSIQKTLLFVFTKFLLSYMAVKVEGRKKIPEIRMEMRICFLLKTIFLILMLWIQ